MTLTGPATQATATTCDVDTLIDGLLREQHRLTAVERFARQHEGQALPAGETRYRSLLPAMPPGPGRQYAFEVDLDRCSGCKSCVAACHSLNGLDDGEAWRTVGTLVSDDWQRPFQQTVTTACHHCVDPGCLNGCPVLAYDKDPVTGIVHHLDDQCIGCQYCILKCPYEVPKYSPARGIVRKCDLCSQRLAAGEAPACVQACPNEAIRITVVETAQVREGFRDRHSDLPTQEVGNPFLPSSPDPGITLPTTRFVAKRPLAPDLAPSDAGQVSLQPAHAPLVWMLVLTQFGVGAFLLLPVLGTADGATPDQAQVLLAGAGLAATALGLAASTLHLGRPLKAWRSFLGWRKSWLSREVLAFGAFFPLATLATALMITANSGMVEAQATSPTAGRAAQALFIGQTPGSYPLPLVILTTLAGLAGVLCSGMVYHDTKRALWKGVRSVGRFFATCALLGLAAAWLCAAASNREHTWLPVALTLVSAIKLAGEHRLLRRHDTSHASPAWPKHGANDEWSLAQTAVLMRDRLGLPTRIRFLCGIGGGLLLPLLSLLPAIPEITLAGAAVVLCLVGEFVERWLFFRCVVPPRMPGSEVAHA